MVYDSHPPTSRCVVDPRLQGESERWGAHLGILLDGDQHSLLQFDVLGCEKVQVCLSPVLFRLVFLDSVDLYKG